MTDFDTLYQNAVPSSLEILNQVLHRKLVAYEPEQNSLQKLLWTGSRVHAYFPISHPALLSHPT